ncbi:MAG TPA: c-type cytochrome [Longimicrobiaceae bacterium]|nr:c-type cytochrome [Longimicrobiaceae bacterium]
MSAPRTMLAVAALLALCAGCSRSNSVSEGGAPQAALPPNQLIERLPLGDLAGAAPNLAANHIPNPYAGNAAAITAGKALFSQMNCVSCHAYDATGGMGPDLTDSFWRYGGAPAQVYASIFDGRPKGMPAWGKLLTSEEIWKIVAYLQTLGGTVPASFASRALQGDEPHEVNALNSMKGAQSEDYP